MCTSLHNPNASLRYPNDASNKKCHRPAIPKTLQGLLFLYALAAIALVVAYYDVTLQDTMEFARTGGKWKQTTKTTTTFLPSLLQSVPAFSSSSSSPPKVVFVHPGKTGGTSLGRFLRLFCQVRNKPDSRRHCFQEFWNSHRAAAVHVPETNTALVSLPETAVSQYTQGGIHVDWIYPDNDYIKSSTHFLISVRNPMERVMSWFYFMHPINCYQVGGKSVPRQKHALIDKACITKQNMERSTNSQEYLFYRTCFPQVEQFVQALGGHDNKSIDAKCVNLARDMLQGQGGPNGMAGHLYSNYTYYAKLSSRAYPKKPILVARTESLWQDLAHIDEEYLGGTGEAFANQLAIDEDKRKSKSKSPEADHYHKDKLSPQGYQILCCAIQPEVAVYQEWLDAAINLQPDEKQASLQRVLNQCMGITDADSDATSPRIHSLEDLAAHCDHALPNLDS